MLSINIPTSGLKEFVARLANEHGVIYKRIWADEFAEAATQLAGDNIISDEVENLVVALRRAYVIDSKKMIEILSKYYKERYHV